MMKKLYIQPTLEILPFCAITAMCASGDKGADPEAEGRFPRPPHIEKVF